jgi:SAM-dependent methyltransferase
MMVLKILGVVALSGLVLGGGFAYWAFGAFLPWREAEESRRLMDVAGIRPGQMVAEIGSGSGRFTVAVAERVGSSGRVYSTELNAENRAAVHERVRSAGLDNVTIVEAAPLRTNLPDACCDVVFMRNVYHHIGDPVMFANSLEQAVRPGGRLAVMDFEPGALWFHGGRPDGASERRPGHGVARAAAIAELTGAGFTVEQEIADWSGPMWMVVFKKAE